MSTITPVKPSVVGGTVTGTTPTASDVIPAAAYRWIILVVRTGATNTYQASVDDPVSQGPSGATAFNPDLSTGTVATNSVKAFRLDCTRFRDINGNINLTSSSTFTGTTLEAYGVAD